MDDDLVTSRACPYCLAEVPTEAIRCRHCAGDLVATSDGPDLAGFWIIGIIVSVIGLAIAAGSDGGDGEWVGLVVAGVGGVLLQVGVIASGVSIGLRHRDYRSYLKRRTNADLDKVSSETPRAPRRRKPARPPR